MKPGTTFPGKVAPPGLKGKKTGVFVSAICACVCLCVCVSLSLCMPLSPYLCARAYVRVRVRACEVVWFRGCVSV